MENSSGQSSSSLSPSSHPHTNQVRTCNHRINQSISFFTLTIQSHVLASYPTIHSSLARLGLYPVGIEKPFIETRYLSSSSSLSHPSIHPFIHSFIYPTSILALYQSTNVSHLIHRKPSQHPGHLNPSAIPFPPHTYTHTSTNPQAFAPFPHPFPLHRIHNP